MIAHVASGTGSGATTFSLLSGWNIRETAAAPARVTLRKDSSGGSIIADIQLPANGTAASQMGTNPIAASTSDAQGSVVYVNVESGSVAWQVYGR